ncbi:hypothetical protein CSKR_114036 [Clonorchis sinensis]|uniref:Uncharacterized protein n=2 Tax=Clonorchis sinensis TaxID=79923 RepID=G7YEB6_CLOSI|nr:hypothetical protein CSKR_114036 [Clonorchis sinensis]GAA51299.1 hypothetical protein CLF_105858 [Clonorchis sinensis]
MRLSTRLLADEPIDWKCPDWRQYTLDHPMLQKHVKRLSAKGLKDPWIRNYAWHFAPNVYQTPWQFTKAKILVRAPHGFALAVLLTIAIRGYEHFQKTSDVAHE